ncbi:MAG: TauD/TfdA family dioxygenase [Lautropia sp.]
MQTMLENDPVRPATPMPGGPVIDPADWRGPRIKDGDDWIYQLDAADIADLEAAMRTVEQRGIPLEAVTKDLFSLPLCGQKLQAVRNQLVGGLGLALIRGLPIERYTREQTGILYWGISRHLGTPVPTNLQGHLISHVVNLGTNFANPDQEATYSRDTFAYHTDECDIVGLLCLHPAKSGGASTVASSIAIHNEIQIKRPDLLKILYQPFHIDRRGSLNEGGKPWYEMPVFMWHQNRLLAWVQPGRTKSGQRFDQVPRLTEAQKEAQHLLQELADDPRFRLDMAFNRGDMQFLNNHVVVHSRTEYDDWPELGRRRHLLRVMLVAPDIRALSPWFAAPMARTPRHRGGVYMDAAPNITLYPVLGAGE